MLIFLAKNMTVCDRTESNWNGPIFSATTEPCNINYRHTFNRIFFWYVTSISYSFRNSIFGPWAYVFAYVYIWVFVQLGFFAQFSRAYRFKWLKIYYGFIDELNVLIENFCSPVRLLRVYVSRIRKYFSQQNEKTKKEIDLCFKLWPSLTQMNANICTQKPQLKV